MRKRRIITSTPLFGLFIFILTSGCQKDSMLNKRITSMEVINAKVEWDREHQKIDGFGAFGGRIGPFFESPKRDSILDYLWGNTGLKLNILRGKVLHTYPFDNDHRTVRIKPENVDIDININKQSYKTLSKDEQEHLGQLWIMKKAKERFNVPVIMASAWTPPLYMKNVNRIDAKYGNGLNLWTSSTLFAQYLAGFVKAYQNEGIIIDAISPSNEPENVFSDWDASYWAPNNLGEFITKNLKPALNEVGLKSTKIISQENAAWGTANNLYFPKMDRTNIDILAAHGYVEFIDLILGKRGLNQSPSKWTFPTEGKPIWVTEASDDSGKYDAGMDGGMKLAINMHKLIAECDASAYIFWLGMLPSQDNEALICTRKDGSLEFTKAYDVMGHYSRFIKAGYKRINVAIQNNDLLISAYKEPETGKFAIVITNPSSKDYILDLNLEGIAGSKLSNYQTTSNSKKHWELLEVISPKLKGIYSITIPAKSISTLDGAKEY